MYRAAKLRGVKGRPFKLSGDILERKKPSLGAMAFLAGCELLRPYYLKRDGIAAPVENL